jgi:hypothetical protein
MFLCSYLSIYLAKGYVRFQFCDHFQFCLCKDKFWTLCKDKFWTSTYAAVLQGPSEKIVYRRLTICSVTWKKSLLPDANVIYKEVNYMFARCAFASVPSNI